MLCNVVLCRTIRNILKRNMLITSKTFIDIWRNYSFVKSCSINTILYTWIGVGVGVKRKTVILISWYWKIWKFQCSTQTKRINWYEKIPQPIVVPYNGNIILWLDGINGNYYQVMICSLLYKRAHSSLGLAFIFFFVFHLSNAICVLER